MLDQLLGRGGQPQVAARRARTAARRLPSRAARAAGRPRTGCSRARVATAPMVWRCASSRSRRRRLRSSIVKEMCTITLRTSSGYGWFSLLRCVACSSEPEPSSSSPRPSPSVSCRSSASSPSKRASASPRCSWSGSRSPRRSSGAPSRVRRVFPRGDGSRRAGAGAGAGRGRLRDAGRAVLPGPGAHGRLRAVPGPLQLPRTGDGGGDPPRARSGQPPASRRPRHRFRAASCWCWRAPERARWTSPAWRSAPARR